MFREREKQTVKHDASLCKVRRTIHNTATVHGPNNETKKLERNERGELKNALENKNVREKKGVGGAGNRRGMLCWRTRRGKPQEGVRGRDEERGE